MCVDVYMTFLHASSIHSGSGAGMLRFQACTSHSKNNFHSVLPCDSLLVGWGGVLEENREEKWMSCWMCSTSSDSAVLCRDGLPLILTHTRERRLNHSYWQWEDASLLPEVPCASNAVTHRRPDTEHLATGWIRDAAFLETTGFSACWASVQRSVMSVLCQEAVVCGLDLSSETGCFERFVHFVAMRLSAFSFCLDGFMLLSTFKKVAVRRLGSWWCNTRLCVCVTTTDR